MVLAAMTRFGVGLASVLMCAVLAAPVDAQATGNGLYEPFPTVAARKRAKRFLDQLPVPRVSDADLDRGSFTSSALRPAPGGAASSRAIASDGPPAWLIWAVLGGLTVACALPALRRG
jgi:hypothetical protein